MKGSIDMLHGPLLLKLLVFALPLAASSMLQQLFNSIDVIVVGQFAGSEALAAVGCNGPVVSLFINLFVGLSVGANVVIANYLGQGDEEQAKRTTHTVLLLSAVCGIAVMLLGLLVSRPLLVALNAPEELLGQATRYLRLLMLGMPFFMVYNFGAAILRSKGDTRRPLYCLAVAGVVNTVLNLLLVIVFHLGVAGVAIATSVSMLLSAVLMIRMLCREQGALHVSWESLQVSRRNLWKVVQIGVPAGVQGVVFSGANVIIQSAVNSFGSAAMAGSAAALNFEFYCYFVVAAFAAACVTFTSQNYGAGDMQRCREVLRQTMWLALVSCLVLNVLFWLLRPQCITLFTSDEAVRPYAFGRMTWVLLPQWLACSYELCGAALRGIGRSLLPALITVFGTCMLRLVWVWGVFPLCPTWSCLMSVYPLSWMITGTSVVVAYILVWKKVKTSR